MPPAPDRTKCPACSARAPGNAWARYNSASLALAHSERSRSAAIGPVGLLVLIGSGIHKARTRVCFFLASGFQACGYSI